MMNVKFIHQFFISCQIIDFVNSMNYQKLILINYIMLNHLIIFFDYTN